MKVLIKYSYEDWILAILLTEWICMAIIKLSVFQVNAAEDIVTSSEDKVQAVPKVPTVTMATQTIKKVDTIGNTKKVGILHIKKDLF